MIGAEFLHRCMLRVTGYVLRVASYVLRVASYGLRVTSCVLRVASYVLRVAGCGLRVACYVLRVARYKFRVAFFFTLCTMSSAHALTFRTPTSVNSVFCSLPSVFFFFSAFRIPNSEFQSLCLLSSVFCSLSSKGQYSCYLLSLHQRVHPCGALEGADGLQVAEMPDNSMINLPILYLLNLFSTFALFYRSDKSFCQRRAST